jgi:hypothetical protein
METVENVSDLPAGRQGFQGLKMFQKLNDIERF